MNLIDIRLNPDAQPGNPADSEILSSAMAARSTADELFGQERYMDALERIISGMRTLREYSDFDQIEFRAMLMALLFDLAEIHFALKDYKQSEKELEMLFKVLDSLIKVDTERFGPFHILAMELSTRILRSRKKTLEMLVKQQINADMLYEKVNSGVVAATDKLVDSLRKVGQLLASSGDYRAAMKFYAEAIRISKKRTGRVNRKEVRMTIELAEIMFRVRQMRPRARRLLNAILPHAIALETIELEEDVLALIEILDADVETEPRWRTFLHKLSAGSRKGRKEEKTQKEEKGVKTQPDPETLSEATPAPAKGKRSKKAPKEDKSDTDKTDNQLQPD